MRRALWPILSPCLLILITVNASLSQDARLNELRQKAEAGDANMQFWLGAYYEHPQMMVGDPEMARQAPNYAEALKWLSLAAAQGRPEAMALLGQMYEDGEGVSANDGLAAVFYRASCDARPDYRSTSDGCNYLAILYEEGRGVRKDPIEAYKYYAVAQLPPDFLREQAAHFAPTQLVEAKRRIEEWRRQHPTDAEIQSRASEDWR